DGEVYNVGVTFSVTGTDYADDDGDDDGSQSVKNPGPGAKPKPTPIPHPTDPQGNPLPPPVALPPGKDGMPNEWVPIPGTKARPIKWKPKRPVASPKGEQPCASWDPMCGHFDWKPGDGTTERLLPNGTKVDHFNNPINNVAVPI